MTGETLALVREPRPYPPSWLDLLTRAVERARGRAPLVYAAAALLAVCTFALNDWLHTGRGPGSVDPFHLVMAVEPIYTLALLHLLNRRAELALTRMRPLLMCDAAGFADLRYRLTTTPADKTLFWSVAGAAVGTAAIVLERVALPEAFHVFTWTDGQRYLIELWLVFTWFVFGALFYHTYHQLWLISHIYTKHTRIDLDQVQPLFHFSRVSALTAVGLLLLPYGWYATVPGLILDPVGILFGALFPVFALVAFLWPLVGVHNLLVEGKASGLAENARALQDARGQLYRRTAAAELSEASLLNDALTSIRAERDDLHAVPTWPWQPGTPRTVAAALLLPIAVWFIQWLIERLLTM